MTTKKDPCGDGRIVNAIEECALINLPEQERALLHQQNVEEAISIVRSANGEQIKKIIEILRF